MGDPYDVIVTPEDSYLPDPDEVMAYDRRPVVWDEPSRTVYVGQPWEHHSDLYDAHGLDWDDEGHIRAELWEEPSRPPMVALYDAAGRYRSERELTSELASALQGEFPGVEAWERDPVADAWRLAGAGHPDVLYHTSPADVADSILEHGIDWERSDPSRRLPNDDLEWGDPDAALPSWPRGNYLHERPDDIGGGGGGEDAVWRVDARGLDLRPDPYWPEGGGWYASEPVPPERLRRIASADPRIVLLDEGEDGPRAQYGHPVVYDPESDTVYVGGLGMHHSDVYMEAGLYGDDDPDYWDTPPELPAANIWPDGWQDYRQAEWPLEAERAARKWAVENYAPWQGEDRDHGSGLGRGWSLTGAEAPWRVEVVTEQPPRGERIRFRNDRVPGLVDPESRAVYLGVPGDYHDDVRQALFMRDTSMPQPDVNAIWQLPWIEVYADGSLRSGGTIGNGAFRPGDPVGRQVMEAVSAHLGRPLRPLEGFAGEQDPRTDPWRLAAQDDLLAEYKFGENQRTGERFFGDTVDGSLHHSDLMEEQLGATPSYEPEEGELGWDEWDLGWAQVREDGDGYPAYVVECWNAMSAASPPGAQFRQWAEREIARRWPDAYPQGAEGGAGWRLAAMEHTGASVEELAGEQLQDLLGYPYGGPEDEGHRPARPDIAKFKAARRLYEMGHGGADHWLPPDTPRQEREAAAAEARGRWEREYEMDTAEVALVERYLQALGTGLDAKAAFEATCQDLGAPPARLGGALKKYERQHWPELHEEISRLLSNLAGTAPSSYKMWPWAVREAKEEFRRWLDRGQAAYNRNEPSQALVYRLRHLGDIAAEGGSLLHSLRANNAAGLPDANQMSLDDFEDWLMDWKRENRDAEARGEVVYEWPDGWTVQRLTSADQCQWEGDEMGHCVGGYGHQVENGDTLIYSLRDRRGEPHATLEIRPDPVFVEDDAAGQANLFPHADSAEDLEYWRRLVSEGRSDLVDRFFPRRPHRRVDLAPGQAPPESAWGWGAAGAPRLPAPAPVFEVVQIQGRGDGRPKDEYAERLRQWFDSVSQSTGARFSWGPDGDYHGGEGHDFDYDPTYPELDDATFLDSWYDDYWEGGHELYTGGGSDRYGLERAPVQIASFDPEQVMVECAASLLDDYDRDRWKTSDWKTLADATYVASVHAGFSADQFLSELERAEQAAWEWVIDYRDQLLFQGGGGLDERFRELAEEAAAERGWDVEEALGDGWGWGDLESHSPETADDARERYEREVEEAYAGNVSRYFQRLHDLAYVRSGGWPGWGHAPHPREMPPQDSLAEWRNQQAGQLRLPGALSNTRS